MNPATTAIKQWTDQMAATLRAKDEEIARLREEMNRLHRFAVTDPSLTRDEAKAIEPGNTAASSMAIDVWNRAELLRIAAQDKARLREESAALIALLIDQDDCVPPLWYALLPDKMAPLGMSWTECETQQEAESKVRGAAEKAAGRVP